MQSAIVVDSGGGRGGGVVLRKLQTLKDGGGRDH